MLIRKGENSLGGLEKQNKPGYSKVEAWLSRMAPSTRRKLLYGFEEFMKWVRVNDTKFRDMTPDELIQYQFNADKQTKYEVLDQLVQPYLLGIEGRVGYKQKIYSTIRSFFLHNRAELPRDPGFNLGVTREKVRGKLEPEQIRDVVLSSTPTFQAILLSMFQGGLGLAEFNYWNLNGWQSLKKQLDEGMETVRVELPGRKKAKNKRPYHTFIGGDAVNAIRNWLQHRPAKAKAIFTNRFGDPVSSNAVYMTWVRRMRKIGLVGAPERGVKHKRTGRNPHELRDSFRTQWAKSGASADIGEYCLGHDIDVLEYNKCYNDEEYTLREYKRALPMLQLISGSAPYRLVKESVVEDLQRQLEEAQRGQNGELADLKGQVEQMQVTLKQQQDKVLFAMYMLSKLPKETQDVLTSRLSLVDSMTDKELELIRDEIKKTLS